jgi:hypothetical protein
MLNQQKIGFQAYYCWHMPRCADVYPVFFQKADSVNQCHRGIAINGVKVENKIQFSSDSERDTRKDVHRVSANNESGLCIKSN